MTEQLDSLARRRLPACSICLRTQLWGEWHEAEDVIRELRTYLEPTAPRLLPALCDACEEAIAFRRRDSGALEEIAA